MRTQLNCEPPLDPPEWPAAEAWWEAFGEWVADLDPVLRFGLKEEALIALYDEWGSDD